MYPLFISILLVIATQTIAKSISNHSDENEKFARCGNSTRNRPITGETSLGDWPWATALYIQKNSSDEKSSFTCGGSLIDENWVLTAASCTRSHKNGNRYHVRLGDLNIDESVDDKAQPIEIDVQEIIKHPLHKLSPILRYDIALLRLSSPVKFTEYIRPVCLATDQKYLNETYFDTKSGYVAGWGSTKGHEYDNGIVKHLQEIEMKTVPSFKCKNYYDKFIQAKKLKIDETFLCASPTDTKKDACMGFGGAPLMIQENGLWYQGGIVSLGYKCNLAEYPTIFTKVASANDWIEKLTGKKL